MIIVGLNFSLCSYFLTYGPLNALLLFVWPTGRQLNFVPGPSLSLHIYDLHIGFADQGLAAV